MKSINESDSLSLPHSILPNQTMSCKNILELPAGCISYILSLTTPRDVVRSSAVSKEFLSASGSDSVWENFLPSDCDHIISQSSTPFDQSRFASRKDLFFYLCHNPTLFNNSTQSFALDKRIGKKCYMLGARRLLIAWGDDTDHWDWVPIPEARFPETAQLMSVCWLDIQGRFPVKLLSSNTTYGAYFVFQKNSLIGFDVPVKATVIEVGGEGLSHNDDDHSFIVNHCYLEEPEDDLEESEDDRSSISPKVLPAERDDGWVEVEMGRYQVGFGAEATDENVVLEMTLKEVEELGWKSGLLVQGIELRPLD